MRTLAKMEEHKKLPIIKTPDEIADNLSKGNNGTGSQVYFSFCSSCHQINGEGDWQQVSSTHSIRLGEW
jgi:mono/diheme cytochrome c family protein